MASDSIVATYWIETPIALEKAAEIIAGEQSSGTFVSVPGETSELRLRHRAQVVEIEPMEGVDQPSLPGCTAADASKDRTFQRARIRVAFPMENMGCNLPVLMSTVCGNLYELSQLSGIRLMDIELPEIFADRYPGPQFGIEGTRRLCGVWDRPLIGTIIKPSVGLTPQQTAVMVRELLEGGIDFIKDDELMANPPHSPLKMRVNCVMQEVRRHADATGRQAMVAFNITDELDAMKEHHDHVLQAGGTCVMASINQVGLTGMSALRKHCQLPIHGHRNGWGMLTRFPGLGIEFRAYQKIWRAIGIDHLHINGIQNKFWESDDSVMRSLEALREPLWSGYDVLPVISSGQWGGQAPETWRRGKTKDLLYLAGGGIMAHPAGIAGGVRAIRQAWDAAYQGISLEDYARQHHELRQSLDTFGKGRA